MTMKATKLAAILSRLHSAWRLPQATLALALAIAALASPARAAEGDLPNGYAALDGGLYKAAPDNKILVTDYWLNEKTWMEVELKFAKNDAGFDNADPSLQPPDWQHTCILGHCDLNYSVGHGGIVRNPKNPSVMYFAWADGNVNREISTYDTLTAPTSGDKITLRLENGLVSILNESGLVQSSNQHCTRSEGKADGPLALFGYSFSIAPFPYHSHDMTVYSLKIYESADGKMGDDSTLVRDYRPAEKDGQRGLYDVVGGNFFKLSDVSSSNMTIDFNGGTCAALSTFGMESSALVPVIPGEALPEFPAGALPTKSGMVLAGFYDGTKSDSIGGKTLYYTADGKTQQICGTTPPILHAVWVNWTYKINYDLKGGSYSAENPVESATADQAVKVIAPVRNGYRFTGWKVTGYESGAKYALSEGGTEDDVGSATVPCAADGSVWFKNLCSQALPGADTVTLTAQWEYDIPGDYDSIDHLHFDGTHFILTDYCPIEKTWIETEMKVNGPRLSPKDAGKACLFGTNGKNGYQVYFGGSDAQIFRQIAGERWDLTNYRSGPTPLEDGKCKLVFARNLFSMVTQGGVEDKRTTKSWGTYDSTSFPYPNPLVIGGVNNSDNMVGTQKPGYGIPATPFCNFEGGLDVYSFTIHESENGDTNGASQSIRHEFVPVSPTNGGVAGLYDIIGRKFYPLQTQTVVTLNANGGNALATNYVYATAGEKMPSPIEVPTRNGYTFAGYSAEGWEVKPMTGKETDIINTGTGLFAYSAGGLKYTLNDVDFEYKLKVGENTFLSDGKPTMTFSSSISSSDMDSGTEDKVAGTGYGDMLRSKALIASSVATLTVRLSELTQGHSYLVQIVCHEGQNPYQCYGLKVDGVDYECNSKAWGEAATSGSDPNLRRVTYGRSFVYRFEATSATHSFDIGKYGTYIHINAMQLRDVTGTDDSPKYYDAEGTSDHTYPISNGPTELFAQWELEPTEITGVLLADYEAVYDGSAKTPQIAAVMTASGVRLTADDAALGWDVTYERERVATTDLVSEGKLQVVVTGKGKLSGTARANYRIVNPNKIALPKPTDVFKYTGAAITPTFTPTGGYTIAANGYTPTSGTIGATQVGTYRVTCTLESGKMWENGSTAPYDVTWQIVDKTFLERLAEDEHKVASSPIATGGDLILNRGNTYIHVFTNTSEVANFTPSQNLNARVLLVGGGGAGGYSGDNNAAGSGGGAGGMVEALGVGMDSGEAYEIRVGAGAAAATGVARYTIGEGLNCGSNSWIKLHDLPMVSIAYGGGNGGNKIGTGNDFNPGQPGGSGGGGSWDKNTDAPDNPGGAGVIGQGYDGGTGCGGGNAQAWGVGHGGGGGAGGPGGNGLSSGVGGNGGGGRLTDILGFDQYFAGGGGSGSAGDKAYGYGGVGGGGNGRSGSVSNAQTINGENGLGGGGGGGSTNFYGFNPAPGRGGDGIVIIAYEHVASGDSEAPVPESWNEVREVGWTGKTLIGVEAAPYGSTLSSNYYGDAEGEYTAIATLAPGYTQWSDGSTALSREIEWEIVDTKTWYLVVTDDPAADNYGQSSFSKDQVHWNRDPNATVGVSHQAAVDYHYVVPAGKTIALIHGDADKDNAFAGESLALGGTMALRNPAREKTIRSFVGQGGLVRAIDQNATYALNGDSLSVAEDQSLAFRLVGTSVYNLKFSQIEGAGKILLEANDEGSATGLMLSGNASGFTGKIAMAPGSTVVPQNFTLTIANAFGGTIESLPSAANVTEVRFNSGANVGGLVVSSTVIPEALKTKLVVYGYNLTAADKPLVTFPAGTAVNAAEFAIKCAQNSTAAGSAVGALMTVENDDHTISLYPLRVNVTLDNDGGLPATQSVRVSAGGTMPTVAELPTKDGFAFLGYFSASGVRYYNADGTGVRECDFTEATTLKAKWLSTEEYTLLPSLDNGNSLDAAGYVALTNFHLTGTNVVELKYCVNAENNDKWQDMFWSRMPDKSYSLVLRPPNHSFGYKWQVTYGEGTTSVNNYDYPTLGRDYVLRLCPTNDVNQGLLAYLDGDPVRWEIGTTKYTMFDDEAIVDTLLFAAGRTDSPVNDEPNRDGTGKMTSPALAKMYYFRVENSATDPTARLDLVPVRRTDGVRGFYDLVNGGFYPLKTPVVLDGNGGEPAQQYVYTSNGEPMPALPNNPTRTDYGFLGYYDAGTQYYDEKGMPVKACDFGEGTTTLRAHWLLTNTKARQELEEAFDSEKTGTTVEPVIVDGEIASYTVVLARDYDQGVTLPGDLGPVTIDMNGWTIRGTNGVDGATTTVGGESLAGTDGGPAITVSDASGADAGVTAITVTEVWAEYMIIDLRLSGPESVSYEVAYSFDEATNRYNTLEYKTDKIVFRKIPACTFTMGSPEDEVGRAKDKKENWRNPETQHEVTLTQDYYIGLFPVTRRQWKLVMGSCPSDADDETRPVGSVTYQMIRGSGDGIDVSKLQSGGSVGEDGFLAALRAKSGLDYLDLPTEAQWECAARAGTTTSTFFGDNVKNWSEAERKAKVYPYLWYDENSSGVSHGVGQVFPNPWGLYDTLGNVWEWCLDRVTCAPNDDWGTEAVTDPLRKVEEDGRVPARGGKTDDNLDYSRSAARDGNSVVNRGADAATPNYGLRLAGICPVDEDNGRPAAGTSSAVIGGNGGNGYPPGKGSPAVTDATGAKVTVTDPLTLVSDGNDGERWAYDLHVIRDEAGAPTVVVPTAWLKDAYPEAEVSESAYQTEFLKPNASGVKDWQSYVLGYGPKELATVAIVEETVQNADPDTVTIRLKDMPAPRTGTGCTVKYSLYSATTPGGLANGSGEVVTGCGRKDQSTFEAPLGDLDDDNPVRYYRIKVHFIFNKSE